MPTPHGTCCVQIDAAAWSAVKRRALQSGRSIRRVLSELIYAELDGAPIPSRWDASEQIGELVDVRNTVNRVIDRLEKQTQGRE